MAFAKEAAAKQGVEGNTSWIIDDYRNIPQHNGGQKYDKITCVEMAEHVGIKNFQPFLLHVHSMLKDDGMFYIQMCGVRRTWCFEDIVWILFMGKYIFPGADASTAINFVVNQLERSGMSILSTFSIFQGGPVWCLWWKHPCTPSSAPCTVHVFPVDL